MRSYEKKTVRNTIKIIKFLIVRAMTKLKLGTFCDVCMGLAIMCHIGESASGFVEALMLLLHLSLEGIVFVDLGSDPCHELVQRPGDLSPNRK